MEIKNSRPQQIKLTDLFTSYFLPKWWAHKSPHWSRVSKWAAADKEGPGRWSGDSEGEVNSAEGIGRQWSGLMSHETGFTGAEALPNPHGIHFAITMINWSLNASLRQCSRFHCTACQIFVLRNVAQKLIVVRIWLGVLLSQLFGMLTGADTFWVAAKGQTRFKPNPEWHLDPSTGAPLRLFSFPDERKSQVGMLEPLCQKNASFEYLEWPIATLNELLSTLRTTRKLHQCPSRSGANPGQISRGFGECWVQHWLVDQRALV